MLGLNLNTTIPFSPVPEIPFPESTPEEEVDAVTGRKNIYDSRFTVQLDIDIVSALLKEIKDQGRFSNQFIPPDKSFESCFLFTLYSNPQSAFYCFK